MPKVAAEVGTNLQAASDLPCTPPPWGTLSAVDMDKGAIQWQVPLGSMQYFGGGHEPVPPGSIGFGGPIITAGGLAFIAGTFDLRAAIRRSRKRH